MKTLCIDVETGGTNPQKHSILQIYADYHIDGRSVSTFSSKFMSNCDEMDLGALKVNKTNFKTLSIQKKEMPEPQVITEFVDFLLSLDNKEKVTVLGHNPRFDLNFIEQFLAKNGVVGLDSILSYRVIDTSGIGMFLNDAGVIKWDRGGLTGLAEALGIQFDKSALHEAQADVDLTYRVYYTMVELLKRLKKS